MANQLEKLLHYYRNAANPQAMADKVIAAIATLDSKWNGKPMPRPNEEPKPGQSTFVYKRSGGMFNPSGGNRT